ncbi:Uncharacterised protein [Vibrio cholerae]|nr:Uncharacterised protein [Vibrio cholerae]
MANVITGWADIVIEFDLMLAEHHTLFGDGRLFLHDHRITTGRDLCTRHNAHAGHWRPICCKGLTSKRFSCNGQRLLLRKFSATDGITIHR